MRITEPTGSIGLLSSTLIDLTRDDSSRRTQRRSTAKTLE
jgi:hypothetical protein